jgi:hypothetical protein
MPADAKLYLNPNKWGNQDVVDMIHVTVQKVFGHTNLPNIRMGSTGYGDHFFMDYLFKTGPGMLMIKRSEIGGIPAMLISGSANNEKRTHFLKAMAERYGGLLMESETDGMLEEFQDPFEENEDFTLRSIQKGGNSYTPLDNRTNQEIDELIENLQKMKTEEQSGA